MTSAEKVKTLFEKICHKEGEATAQNYINQLKKAIDGDVDQPIKKFVKFKTFKKNHIDSVKADDALFEKDMLNNEDIRLFVDVIDENDDAKDKYRRITSINLSRSNSRLRSSSVGKIRSSITAQNLSASNLSASMSSFKFRNKKIKFKILPKHNNSKSINNSPVNLNLFRVSKDKIKYKMKKNLVSLL